MKDKISVIIPIYKVEKYLKKCIDSVINQTYSNLEIILVDDGSPDDCPTICDEYAKRDNRIIVIHKTNGGLSDARNCGIVKATGKYISFIDSDDYVSNDYIEYLYRLIVENNGDISIVLPQVFFDEQKSVEINNKKEKIKIYNPKDALLTMMYQKEFDTSAWGKLYNRKLFRDVKFPVRKLYEDISTIYKTFLKSKVIVYSNQKKYFYLKRNDSIMGRKFKNNDMDYIYQTLEVLNFFLKSSDKSLFNASKCRFLNANFSILLKLKKDNTDNKEVFLKEIIYNIKKYGKSVFFDKNCRLKTKVALILFWVNLI